MTTNHPEQAQKREEEKEEKDTYELMLEQSGCIQQHEALQDCFFDNGRDWRKCQNEMKAFKECMGRQHKKR